MSTIKIGIERVGILGDQPSKRKDTLFYVEDINTGERVIVTMDEVKEILKSPDRVPGILLPRKELSEIKRTYYLTGTHVTIYQEKDLEVNEVTFALIEFIDGAEREIDKLIHSREEIKGLVKEMQCEVRELIRNH